MPLIFEELTHKIRCCIYNLHNTVGVGYDEETYHNGLKHIFRKKQIPYSSRKTKELKYREEKIKSMEYDLLVYDKIILELKNLQTDFVQANYVQLISYLKHWKKNLGLLVNFGLPKVYIKRIPFSEKEKNIYENYEYIKNCISQEERLVLGKIRKAILNIYNDQGLGYGNLIYSKMVKIELNYQKIQYLKEPVIKVTLDNICLREYPISHFLIDNRVLLDVIALHEKIQFYDVAKTRTYLQALKLKTGLIVNFGKRQLQILGVRV